MVVSISDMYHVTGLVQQPKFSPIFNPIPYTFMNVSWLGLMKAARVNVSNIMYFIEQIVFILIVI